MFFRTLLIGVLFLSCSKNSYNNPCDPESKSFAMTFLVMAVSGEEKNSCFLGLTIKDNFGLLLSTTTGRISEHGGNATVGSSLAMKLNLGSEPKQDVNVNIVVSNPSYATVIPTSIVWTSNDWNTERVITVTAVNDTLLNGTRDFLIRLVPTSADNTLRLQERLISMQIFDNDKRLFVNSTLTKGNLGGIAGADATCSSDPKCPVGSQCKAMLSTDSGIRRATITGDVGDGQVDWVLKPFASYFQSDNTTPIGTTNAVSLFTLPIVNGIESPGVTTWTGLGTSWQTDPNDCSNWTNSISGNGIVGSSSSNNVALINNLNVACTSDLKFYCAEQ
ncbi:DUF1554 domain-containing protein [Leptospira bandrabouensis]|uniref:DUF1554 domain-containing protein n=1 Tax=Leptospira bandrabouensis TaxID=2484903 RepID=UPI00223DA89F|nr:DUF1554 domain-containing protein [Leptospira bandrabouensis]MCW7458148.1 DUF1554 domain-containing protein [Leptospira bandrabouensis]MCW7476810.1 DUF1554 domain-containing protein [Leptospira bandrabouensis]MCW7484492.1 DUF1554 domain-containing protein [Leptospira bandrabouensis]